MANSSLEEQLKLQDKLNAEATVKRVKRNEKEFSSMIERQQQMLLNFYKASSDAGRESIRNDMDERQRTLNEQLESMKKSYALYSKYMTNAEKRTFQQMYNTSKSEMDKIDKEMRKRFDGLDEDIDELAETFSERIERIGNELQELSITFNVQEIANSLTEGVDSYIQNVRQLNANTGDSFDERLYSSQVDALNRELKAVDRARASESISGAVIDFGMKKMEEVANYTNVMASAEVLGMSKDDLSGIMWKDLGQGQSGRMLRGISNMAYSLQDNEDLYVHANTILTAINGNIDAIYGLTYRDSKGQVKMVKSLSILQALSETEANEGVTSMTEKFMEWSKLTVPELAQNDEALNLANRLGMNLVELQSSITDSEKIDDLILSFQDYLSGMNDYQLSELKESLGFDYVYQLREISSADLSSSLQDISNSITSLKIDENGNYAETTADALLENANQTVGGIEAFKNDITSNPIAKAISDFCGEFDIDMANAANFATVAFASVKGIQGIKGVLSSDGIGKLIKSLSGSGGATTTAATGLFGKATGGLSSLLSSGTAQSLLSGTALKTGGKALLGTAALGVTGAISALVDGVKGFNKSEDWLGEAGSSVSGKVTSTVGGVLGGTGSGVGNILGNAGKYAAIGGAIGSIIPGVGTAIGAGVGAIAGAVTGALGGENITKIVQKTWDSITGFASSAWESTKGFASSAWDSIKGFASSTFEKLKDTWSNVKETAGNVVSSVKGFFGYANGLSYVPNDGLALIHQGEAVLTKAQADIVRAQSDGGINVSDGSGLSGIMAAGLSSISSVLNEYFMTDEENNDKLIKEFKKNGVFGSLLKNSSTLSSKVFGALFGSSSTPGTAKSTGILGSVMGSVSNLFSGSSSSSGSTSATSTSAPTASGSGNASSIWNYFSGKGLSSAGIAGILGNMQAESGLSTTNLQNSYEKSLGMSDSSYTSAVDSGSYANFINDAAGYGLVQWTHSSLKKDLISMAKSKGTSIGDLNTQLDTLWSEISGNATLMKTLKNATSVEEASNAFMLQFERPADQSSSAMSARAAYGQNFYNQFAAYAEGTPWVPGDQIALIHRGEMVVPADLNPLSDAVDINTLSSNNTSSSGYDDSGLTETLKWMVYRLEAKLDKLISASASVSRRKPVDSRDTDLAFSL